MRTKGVDANKWCASSLLTSASKPAHTITHVLSTDGAVHTRALACFGQAFITFGDVGRFLVLHVLAHAGLIAIERRWPKTDPNSDRS
jgi:hypothetical protein